MKKILLCLILIFTVVSLTGCLFPNFPVPSQNYTLSITIEGNGVVDPPSGSKYSKNTVVTLTPYPAGGWVFDHWGGFDGAEVINNEITMTRNMSITAVFIQTGLISITIN